MYRLVWALVREWPGLSGTGAPRKTCSRNLRLEKQIPQDAGTRVSILDEKSASLKKGDMFDGDTAFTLYDTYGFPLD